MYCWANALAKRAARGGFASVTVTVRMFVLGFDVVRTAAARSGCLSFLLTRRATAGDDTSWAAVAACRVGSPPATPVPAMVELRLSVWSSRRAVASYSFFWVL